MTTTDYTALTPEQWEDLGRRIREAEAQVSGPAGNFVSGELQGYSARELRAWRTQMVERQAEISAEMGRRLGYTQAVVEQIDRALRG